MEEKGAKLLLSRFGNDYIHNCHVSKHVFPRRLTFIFFSHFNIALLMSRLSPYTLHIPDIFMPCSFHPFCPHAHFHHMFLSFVAWFKVKCISTKLAMNFNSGHKISIIRVAVFKFGPQNHFTCTFGIFAALIRAHSRRDVGYTAHILLTLSVL